MSKGSRVVTMRVPPELEERIMATIESNNAHTNKEPWTITTWILDCVREKLRHQSAAKVQREKRRQTALERKRLARLCALTSGKSPNGSSAG